MDTVSILVGVIGVVTGISLIYFHLYRSAYRARQAALQSEARARLDEVTRLIKPVLERQAADAQLLTQTFSPRAQTTEPAKTTGFDDALLTAAAFHPFLSSAADSAQYLADAFRGYQSVSTEFVRAVEHMAHQHFDSGADLSAYLRGLHGDGSTLSWLFSDIPKSTLDNLKGHYGDQLVGSAMHAAGNEVIFPPDGSQPGWDLILNGHETQVKTVADVHHVWDHLDKYPHIPVLVSAQAAGLPHGLPHIDLHHIDQLANFEIHPGDIIAVDHLDPHAAYDAVHHASEAATGGAVDAHLPWITIALGTYREAKLLSQGHTDLGTSLKNVSLDAVGTGVGVLAGGKAGAVAGAFVAGPPGALVGAAIGAIAGAIGGRTVTNQIKYSDAQEAHSKVQAEIESLPSRITQHVTRLREEVRRQSEAANAEFLAYRKSVQAEQLAKQRQVEETRASQLRLLKSRITRAAQQLALKTLAELNEPSILAPSARGAYQASLDFYAERNDNLSKEPEDLSKAISEAALTGVQPRIVAQGAVHLIHATARVESEFALLIQSLAQKLMAFAIHVGQKLEKSCDDLQSKAGQSMSGEILRTATLAGNAADEWRRVDRGAPADALTELEKKLRAMGQEMRNGPKPDPSGRKAA